ncbi:MULTISPECIES: ExbD/TolR family protein [unclassified Yoonia]|uniref:ExbD/TolR family protein n=1 Tax=unclassified Yoonia TaxID=2629118 RepID=UPI002AFE1EA5|nr:MULTISPECIES: biopolymer transporter ExbD [unclassified Yoonia]
MPRPVRQRRRLSLTSLIDVIFLLLLFFMLSSTFTRFGDLPFMAATGGATADGTPPAFLRISADAITLNVAEVTLAGLPAALGTLDGALVLVAPSEDVTAQRLVDVLVAAQTVPGVSLRLIGG